MSRGYAAMGEVTRGSGPAAIHENKLGDEARYLRRAIRDHGGFSAFRTGAGSLYRELMRRLPHISGCSAERAELCRKIAETAYPLAARVFAQAVEITLSFSPEAQGFPSSPPTMMTATGFDIQQGKMLYAFVPPNRRRWASVTRSKEPTVVASGLLVTCRPLRYRYHALKDTRKRWKHIKSNIFRDWSRRDLQKFEEELKDLRAWLGKKPLFDPLLWQSAPRRKGERLEKLSLRDKQTLGTTTRLAPLVVGFSPKEQRVMPDTEAPPPKPVPPSTAARPAIAPARSRKQAPRSPVPTKDLPPPSLKQTSRSTEPTREASFWSETQPSPRLRADVDKEVIHQPLFPEPTPLLAQSPSAPHPALPAADVQILVTRRATAEEPRLTPIPPPLATTQTAEEPSAQRAPQPAPTTQQPALERVFALPLLGGEIKEDVSPPAQSPDARQGLPAPAGPIPPQTEPSPPEPEGGAQEIRREETLLPTLVAAQELTPTPAQDDNLLPGLIDEPAAIPSPEETSPTTRSAKREQTPQPQPSQPKPSAEREDKPATVTQERKEEPIGPRQEPEKERRKQKRPQAEEPEQPVAERQEQPRQEQEQPAQPKPKPDRREQEYAARHEVTGQPAPRVATPSSRPPPELRSVRDFEQPLAQRFRAHYYAHEQGLQTEPKNVPKQRPVLVATPPLEPKVAKPEPKSPPSPRAQPQSRWTFLSPSPAPSPSGFFTGKTTRKA